MASRRGDALDGVLMLDKPAGITSNHALLEARRLLDARKAGHTGTLDPLASGLLPLTFGEATKFSGALLLADKTYVATLRLGVETDSGDAEGAIVATAAAPVAVTAEQFDAALSRFTGTIAQVPPMHSAIKRGGRPLYEYARAGVEVPREARQVTISHLRRLSLEGNAASFEVDCSKGTYVRTLAIDIGRVLGCGAHLAGLRRTRVGAWHLEQAVPLARLRESDLAARRGFILPAAALLGDVPRLELDAMGARRLRLGQRIAGIAPAGAPRDRVQVYGPDEDFIGIGRIDGFGTLAPLRLVAGTAGITES